MAAPSSPPAPRIVHGYAAHDSHSHLVPFSFSRRCTGAEDVTFKITHCGICHTDLHFLRNAHGLTVYPVVPGHEMVGNVTEVGSNVKRFKPGDRVGVGCMVNSCGECDACNHQTQQYCKKRISTYGSVDLDWTRTMGGYSTLMVANQRFILSIPDSLPMDAAAPLLCAGISVYSPMKHFGMCMKGKSLGVVGLGGLGHMVVKFGKAFGLEVTVISTSPSKEKEAREVLGADHFINSKNENEMLKAEETLDNIIDTVSASHALEPELKLLKLDGKLVMLSVPSAAPVQLPLIPLVRGRRSVAGSAIGGIEETQEMLEFCAQHNISCSIEKIPMDYINTALQRLQNADVKYRFVLDIAETLTATEV